MNGPGDPYWGERAFKYSNINRPGMMTIAKAIPSIYHPFRDQVLACFTKTIALSIETIALELSPAHTKGSVESLVNVDTPNKAKHNRGIFLYIPRFASNAVSSVTLLSISSISLPGSGSELYVLFLLRQSIELHHPFVLIITKND